MAFMAAALLASCSDGKDKDYSGDFGQIKVPDTRQLEQTVTADETQAAQGVTFTTEGAWTSTITQTRAEAPDWISVSPNHGDAAGPYTLKITLDSNSSEETRAAKIVVTCGTSKIEINVTQEGTDNPITPTLNSRISKIEYYRDVDKPTIISRQIANLHFEYDGQGRITSYKYEDMESPSDGIEQAITLTYPDSKTLKIKSTEDDEDEAFTVTLNNAGYATEIRRDGGSERWTVSYDSDNRCTECRQTGTDQSTDCPRSAFDWSNGNLVAFNSFKANGDKAPEYSHTIAYDANTTNRFLSMSLDLNALLFNANPGFISDYDSIGILLASAGRMGIRSANLTKTNLMDEDLPDITKPADPESSYTRYYYEILPEDVVIEWEQDNEGRVTRAFCTSRVLSIKENTKTGQKEVIEEECYTQKDVYIINY